MAETYRAKQTVWYNLQCRDTLTWLSYDGLTFTGERKYGWRGSREQLKSLQEASEAAATCRTVREPSCTPYTGLLDLS